eukprot:Lankesteria_metandrocarpae@DN3521_c0_g1_i3.p1
MYRTLVKLSICYVNNRHSPQTANSDEGIQNDEASYQRPSTTVDKIKRNHKKLHGIHTRRFTEPDVLSGVPLNTQAIRMLKDLYHERWGTTPPRPPPSESPEPCQRTQGSAGLLLPPPPSSKSSEPCQRTQLSAGVYTYTRIHMLCAHILHGYMYDNLLV